MPLTDDSFPTSYCNRVLHFRAQAGIRLFNQGHYFEAHEELEAAWRAEPGAERNLYQGILQVGVGYYHASRGNPFGALKLFRHCRPLLELLPDTCMGINLARLRQDYKAIELFIKQAEIKPGTKLDPGMFKPIDWTDPQDESRHAHVQ